MAIRTDLALECRELLTEEVSSITSTEETVDNIKITHVKIENEDGARKIGKPIGNYITIEIDSLQYESDELCDKASEIVCKELKKLIKSDNSAVMVVGLGNRYITPDSVGPKCVSKIFVTRHLKDVKVENFSFDFRPVSAVAPGVLGITGIETEETISSITEKIKPDIIIAVDALAARDLKRLGTTIQISDTGINPGSGVGNNRKELSEKSLGVPVIAIGIPMVVDASTMTDSTIEIISNYINTHSDTPLFKMLGSISSEDRAKLIDEALRGKSENMIVTPNNVDVISEQAAQIIADGINMALHD